MCKTVTSALEMSEEGQKGSYTFKDISEEILARFIEWVHTRDIPAVLEITKPIEQKIKKTENGAEIMGDGKKNTAAELDLTIENYPLLANIHLYIFCGIYLTTHLHNPTFDEITAPFRGLNKPDTLDTQLAVISALSLSFRKLPPHVHLLDWLDEYAAHCIDKLKMQASFHDLLAETPVLSPRMVLSLSPAPNPPWNTQQPKQNYSHYQPGIRYKDAYAYCSN